jgi:glycerophosphoryl diester phosphodiesterase
MLQWLSRAWRGLRGASCSSRSGARSFAPGPLIAALVLLSTATAHAFDLQGHRGARGLHPENTLKGFEAAIALGVTTLETDLALTRDGQLVLSHDPLLNPDIARSSDGNWVAPGIILNTLTLAELRAFDVGRLKPGSAYAAQWSTQAPQDGARMPTFDELAALVKRAGRPIRLNIETKLHPGKPSETAPPDAFVAAIITAIRKHGLAAATTVQSFDWRTLRIVQQQAPEIATACLTVETERTNNIRTPAGSPSWTAGLNIDEHQGSVPRLVRAAGCQTWSPFWRNVDAARLNDAKLLGLTTVPWTVNDPAEMRRLIEIGVDGLITDYPDRAAAVVAANSQRQSPKTGTPETQRPGR